MRGTTTTRTRVGAAVLAVGLLAAAGFARGESRYVILADEGSFPSGFETLVAVMGGTVDSLVASIGVAIATSDSTWS